MTHSEVTGFKAQLDSTDNIFESLLTLTNRPVTTSQFQSKFAHALQAISNPIAQLTDSFLQFEYNAYAVTHHITVKKWNTDVSFMTPTTRKTGTNPVQTNSDA